MGVSSLRPARKRSTEHSIEHPEQQVPTRIRVMIVPFPKKQFYLVSFLKVYLVLLVSYAVVFSEINEHNYLQLPVAPLVVYSGH